MNMWLSGMGLAALFNPGKASHAADHNFLA